MSNNICAGIVLYNPDITQLKRNIAAIIKQVQILYLQDNGSANISDVEKIIADTSSIVLLRNPENKGIAWALNALCKRAESDNFQWILTLDQDSVCPQNMIALYKEYLPMADMLCPKIVDRNYGVLDGNSENVEIVDKCITSGCLLRLVSWRKLRGFDEKMFIDGVDFEFCYRMKKSGMNILRVNDVVLSHEIGNITVRHFLGFRVIVKNHSPFRKYYIAKNIIYMARKQNNVFVLLKSVMQEIKLLGIVLLYEDNKSQKVSRIISGIQCGLTEKIAEVD